MRHALDVAVGLQNFVPGLAADKFQAQSHAVLEAVKTRRRLKIQHFAFLGFIILSREQGAKPFSNREIETLDQLIPYVSHAMRAKPCAELDYSAMGVTALLIADGNGQVQHATARAQQWLSMALHPNAAQGPVKKKMQIDFLPAVQTLCRSVTTIAVGKDAPTPDIWLQNSWGKFHLRAELLHDHHNGGGCPNIAITITRHEATITMLMRRMWQLGLSTAQKQLCLELVRGRPNEAQLAQRLGVRHSTVRDHLDSIYRKLGIHSRGELLQTLTDWS